VERVHAQREALVFKRFEGLLQAHVEGAREGVHAAIARGDGTQAAADIVHGAVVGVGQHLLHGGGHVGGRVGVVGVKHEGQ
nr:hypothetical protein [Tanacetum cinerariifolium]